MHCLFKSLRHLHFFIQLSFCEGIYDKFANALLDAVQSMKVGDGFSEGVAQVGIFLNLIICFSFEPTMEIAYVASPFFPLSG